MATEEARSLLDSLMGGDRNAPLPPGAAVPLSKKQRQRKQNGETGSLLLPGRRSKSCYDKDIDPLFTAWGIDVYELFVNTKSDIGTNPYVVDRGAHEEYKNLPPHEQEALGYHYQLFQKLQELVRQCDRIVNRNQDKLAQEVQRKLSQRGGQDFVETIDELAVDRLAADLWQVEQLQIALGRQYQSLRDVVGLEEEKKQALDKILKSNQEKRQKMLAEQQEAKDASSQEGDETSNSNFKQDEDMPAVKEETEETDKPLDPSQDEAPMAKRQKLADVDNKTVETLELQLDLGRITMEKQQILFDMANTISRLAPLQDAVDQQHRNLNYVKSDISTDKTVCQVSGNFMSSRDADERIAAHYAGKQYVGWKLVRDKYKEMMAQYGRYGPKPPSKGGPGAPYNDDRHGGYGRDNQPGDYHDRNRGRRFGGGGAGGLPPRGGGGFGGDRGDRGPPHGGRWERGGGGDNHRRGSPPPRGPRW
ncbi:hypothetical protein ACA910_018143 [Epithemia clementina (nom. ined.)]